MASITSHVPAGLVDVIRDGFVRYRAVQRDALASRPASDRSPEQRAAANLVCAIDIALHSVSWDDIRPDQSIMLTANDELLLEVVHGGLLQVADRLVVECHRNSAQQFDPDDAVGSIITDIGDLVALHGQARGSC